MKKLLSITVALLIFSISVLGCSASTRSKKNSKKKNIKSTETTVITEDTGLDWDIFIEPTTTEPTVAEDFTIGISMPTKDLMYWNDSGIYLSDEFEALGYSVDLQFANNDIYTQISQIEEMIFEGCKILIIGAIDPASLDSVMEYAASEDIQVIAYNRIVSSPVGVSYYVTYDNYMVGTLQGEFIVDALDLDNENGPFTMEITTGDSGNNDTLFFFDGAMDVLKPYIDSDKIIVKSGETDLDSCSTKFWSSEYAQERMDKILETYYSDGTNLDICLCSNDSVAYGVTNSLLTNYSGSWPIITGKDCDILNVRNIISDLQAMSVFNELYVLPDQVISMVEDIVNGESPEINDYYTYNIPSYLCAPIVVTKENYEEILIDSGYYPADLFN